MRRLASALVAVAAAVSVASEWAALGDRSVVSVAVLDGVAGFVILTCAIVVSLRHRASRVGPIMGAAGVTWFAGTIWSSLAAFHRGPLVQLHMSYPSGRVRGRVTTVLVVAAYVVAILATFIDANALTLALAVGVAAGATQRHRRSAGAARRAGAPALLAAWMFAAVLTLGAVNRIADLQADRLVLVLYDIAVAAGVIILAVDLHRARWADDVVSDVLIDLGESGSGTLENVLSRALGDRSLTIGYWNPADGTYVDGGGRAVEATSVGHDRVATPITHQDAPLAVLVHDVSALDDPALVDAVSSVTRLACANAALRARAGDRIDAVAASRKRIVETAEAQRRRLESQLHDRVECRLETVGALLVAVQQHVDHPLLNELEYELSETRLDLAEFTRGLSPRALIEGGLAAALAALPSPVGRPIDVSVRAARTDPTIEAVVYYVCTEALANVAKHADATRVTIHVAARVGTMCATIEDDGVGGADMSRGSGLRGLVDRVEAIGGSLGVYEARNGGTVVEARVPLA